MEAVKGCIFDRGEKEYDGRKLYSYLVSFVLVTDKPLKIDSETIIMGATGSLTEELEFVKKYKAPYRLGDLSGAMVQVSDMNPNDLEVL